MSESRTDEKPEISLRRAAMDLLARREHSFEELLGKLSARYPHFDPDELIRPVLTRLSEENLQSDERFVEAFVRYKAARGSGPLKIKAELYHKGVDSALLKRYLYESGIDWRGLARQALEKKFAILSAGSAKEYQRYYRFLAQRGFESEDINRVIRN